MSRVFKFILGSLLFTTIAAAQNNHSTMRVRVSRGVLCGLRGHTGLPSYPASAIASGTHGDVIVRLIIGYDGTTKEAKVETGDPVLGEAAVDAVRNWSFRPYLINGAPAEVESSALFEFRMKRNVGKVHWNCNSN